MNHEHRTLNSFFPFAHSPILSSLLLFAFAVPVLIEQASADLVTLKNQKTLEGVIEKEEEDRVVVDIGIGVVSLDPSEIAAIQRSTEAQRRELLRRFRLDYLETARWLPPAREELFEQFMALKDARDRAFLSKEKKQTLLSRTETKEKEHKALRQNLIAVSERLQATDPKDAFQYNRAVSEMNVVMARLSESTESLREMVQEREEFERTILQYKSALIDFKERFASQSASEQDEEDTDFLEGIRLKLAEMEKEFRREIIPIRLEGSEVVVDARLNDRVEVPLLVDTGATVTVISRPLAERLGIDMASLPAEEVDMVLADGSSTQGRMVILRSVAVGEMTVEQSPAAVVEEFQKSEGVEGALGMSFLGKFVFTIDTAKNRLILERLK